ncbi:MAG: hypothetical protein ABEL76_01830 [Bradymonadaceae bacterium]
MSVRVQSVAIAVSAALAVVSGCQSDETFQAGGFCSSCVAPGPDAEVGTAPETGAKCDNAESAGTSRGPYEWVETFPEFGELSKRSWRLESGSSGRLYVAGGYDGIPNGESGTDFRGFVASYTRSGSRRWIQGLAKVPARDNVFLASRSGGGFVLGAAVRGGVRVDGKEVKGERIPPARWTAPGI